MTETPQRYREFRMPDVGEGLQDAEIIRWLVRPGDTVAVGQTVCEVETAKAAVELPVPFAGVVRELCFPEGSTVDVGAPIITVDTQPTAPAAAESEAGEAAPAERTPVLVGYGAAPATPARRARRRNGTAAPAVGSTPPATPAPVPSGSPASALPTAKPPVRKLAKDLGV